MGRKITLSVIKADVGSIGGHTKPAEEMLKEAMRQISAQNRQLAISDALVTYTGDDIALIFSHNHGVGAEKTHSLAWKIFIDAAAIAKKRGYYAAGQDLLVDAPSGNLRGAGPAVAEIEFELLPNYRPAEAFLIFAADKCGPGAYNYALWNTLCNPMKNSGLLLSPKLAQGFTVMAIDMDCKSKDSDRIIKINTAEPLGHLKLAALLRNIDRFAVESAHSNAYPQEQLVSVSATRLHNIAGKYTGKDDPVMIFRTQGIFPAPEEVLEPYHDCTIVTGDCRGSHNMSLMPMAINSPVRGRYCQPPVSCLAFSMDNGGRFSQEYIDMFDGREWELAREEALIKSNYIRQQGFFGIGMASQEEIAYTGLMEMMKELDKRFELRKNPA